MIEVSIEKKREYQARARQKQIDKMQSAEYKERQREKAQLSIQKAIAKTQTSEYKAKQLAKHIRTAEKTKARAAAKASEQLTSKTMTTREYPTKQQKPIKSRGLKGVSRNKVEYELHDKMAELGCICCIIQGLSLPFSGQYVTIHHSDGRTKANCHKKVLPLCAWHHDTPIPTNHEGYEALKDVIPIHAKGKIGGKKAWEALYGSQEELLKIVLDLIEPPQEADITYVPYCGDRYKHS